MRYVALLCLVACGAPFETAHHIAPEGGTEASRPEGGLPEASKDAKDEATPPSDAPLADAGPDTPVPPPVDASHDAPLKEAAPPPDTGCALPAIPSPAVYGVMNVSQYGIALNGGGSYTGTPTPAECRCAATYNCVCLEEKAPVLAGLCTDPMFPNFNSCFMDGTVPVITCY